MANHLNFTGKFQLSSMAAGLNGKDGLLFKDAFCERTLDDAIQRHVPEYRERVYSPKVTLFAQLSQALSPDKSCLDAVARVNHDRIARGEEPASSDTGGYCKGRERQPLGLIKELATDTGQAMERAIPGDQLWRGRHVKVADGSTLTMADTPENQAEYPQMKGQKAGVGYPILRLVVVFSLLTGCALGMAEGPYRGKQTGEHALLRQLFSCFQANDVVIGDAYFAAYFLITILRCLGVDCLFATHGSRGVDFRTGERLGRKDHLATWEKPQRPDWMDRQTYDSLPDTLKVREIEITISVPGFRAKSVRLVTTFLNAKCTSKEELASLYSRRWSAEVNLRALKTTLKIDHLRCKTPEMVRKEIWATLLAYNLIRKLIGEAAHRFGHKPEHISFKGAVQTLNAYQPLWAHPSSEVNAQAVFDFLLKAIARHQVGKRPGRVEPRAVKRRPKPFPRLTVARAEARMALMQ